MYCSDRNVNPDQPIILIISEIVGKSGRISLLMIIVIRYQIIGTPRIRMIAFWEVGGLFVYFD